VSALSVEIENLVANAKEFEVPTLTFDSLVSGEAETIVTHLKNTGLVSISDIPDFSNARQEYLLDATQCILIEETKQSSEMVHKMLADGTTRLTFSTRSGPHGIPPALQQCPGYEISLKKLSDIVEKVTMLFAKAIDANTRVEKNDASAYNNLVGDVSDSLNENMTLSQIVESAYHLDHFHTYIPTERKNSLSQRSISVEMHSDAGLFIAMIAPEFFIKGNGHVQVINNQPILSSGLFIKSHEGDFLNPVLKRDELVFMVGEGFSSWISFAPKLKPVLHGMAMPLMFEGGIPILPGTVRSWYGKMILLPPNFKMKNTNMFFSDYVNATTSYTANPSGTNTKMFSSLACPAGRVLMASDYQSCAVQSCHSTNATKTDAQCNSMCNLQMAPDQANCKKYCSCTPSGKNGTICWMLCIQNLQCYGAGLQRCNHDKQQLTCNASTVRPTLHVPPKTSDGKIKKSTFTSMVIVFCTTAVLFLSQIAVARESLFCSISSHP